MGFFNWISHYSNKKTTKTPNHFGHSIKESGNVFLMLFGAVGMVGVIGASTMTVMKGPVKTMSEVTKRTLAENNMITAGKLALIAAVQQNDGDCDADGIIEPIAMSNTTISGFTGGTEIPASIGTSKVDSWGMPFGYCAWDHGIADCGTNHLEGGASSTQDEYVLAIVSAGPDGVFNTSCNAYIDNDSNNEPDTPLVQKTGGSDDLFMGYTYSEATVASGGLWSLSDPDTAEIAKNLTIKDSSGTEQFAFDAAAGTLQVGTAGQFPSIRTDNLQAITGSIAMLSNVNQLTADGAITGASLAAGSGAITGGSLNVGAGALTAGTATLGATGVASLTSSGAISGSSLTTSGTLNAGASTLGATGVSSLSASGLIRTTGNSELGDELTDTVTIAGNTTIGGTLGVTGLSTLSAINASGQLTMNNTGTANPDIQFTGDGNIASEGDLRIFIDSNNNETTKHFSILKDSNLSSAGSELFRVDESGLVTVQGKITNLTTPTAATDATTKAYVDARVSAGTGFSEADPTINKTGSTNGKYCMWNGSQIVCNGTVTDDDTLASLSCATGQVAEYNGSAWICSTENGSNGTYQEANLVSSVSIPNQTATDIVELTVGQDGDYLIVGKAKTSVPTGYTYHSSNCYLYLNGSNIIDASHFYVGTGLGGSTSTYTHRLISTKTLSAGDTIKTNCAISSDNAPGFASHVSNSISITPIAAGGSNDSGGGIIAENEVDGGTAEYASDTITLTEDGILTATANVASYYGGAIANAGTSAHLQIDGVTCASDLSFEGESANIGFTASATCIKKLPAGTYTIRSRNQPTLASRVSNKLNYYVLSTTEGGGGSIGGSTGDNLGAGGTTTGTVYSQNALGYGYFGSSSANHLRFDDIEEGNELFLKLGSNWEYHFNSTSFKPYVNNVNDLGSSTARWKNGWFGGTVTAATLSGALNGDLITDNTIDSSEIQNNTLTADDLAANSVGASEIAANAVGASEIINNSITTSDILDNTITENDISNSFKARDSDLLDGINSTSFIRSDAADNVSASTEWQDNQQVRFGNDNDFALFHNGSAMYMRGYRHGAWLYMQGEDSGGTNRAMIYANPSNEVRLYYNGAEKLNTRSNGIQVTGSAYASSFLYSSDKRLKENIVSLGDATEKLGQISSYRYNYKADENKTPKIGVMAQEVMKVYPEAVSTDEDGMMAVDYPALVPALIKAVNELSAEVEALKQAQKNNQEK